MAEAGEITLEPLLKRYYLGMEWHGSECCAGMNASVTVAFATFF